MRIDKELAFQEHDTFVCATTRWFVWEDDEITVLHIKERFIPTDGRPRWTNYSTFNCQTHTFTIHATKEL